MTPKENNSAFIDGANLHQRLKQLGWELDYARFRVWLRERYDVANAYLFIGLIPGKEYFYASLEADGYILVYKETIRTGDGKVKGNCDADLVLYAVVAYFEKQFDRAVIVSSDGDLAVLVAFLKGKNVFRGLVSPSNQCSRLLLKRNVPIVYLDTQRPLLSVHKNQTPHPEECGDGEKALGGDETPQSPFPSVEISLPLPEDESSPR